MDYLDFTKLKSASILIVIIDIIKRKLFIGQIYRLIRGEFPN